MSIQVLIKEYKSQELSGNKSVPIVRFTVEMRSMGTKHNWYTVDSFTVDEVNRLKEAIPRIKTKVHHLHQCFTIVTGVVWEIYKPTVVYETSDTYVLSRDVSGYLQPVSNIFEQ